MTREGKAITRRVKVDVWRSLMEVHAAVLSEIEVALDERHRLTVSEFDALINLPQRGLPLRELRDRVVLSQSALSRLMDRLERRAIVTRCDVASDSRAVLMRPTESGRKLTREAARTNAEVVERVFTDRLSPGEFTMLQDVFDRLRRELTSGREY